MHFGGGDTFARIRKNALPPTMVTLLYHIFLMCVNIFFLSHERYRIGPKPKGLGVLRESLHENIIILNVSDRKEN